MCQLGSAQASSRQAHSTLVPECLAWLSPGSLHPHPGLVESAQRGHSAAALASCVELQLPFWSGSSARSASFVRTGAFFLHPGPSLKKPGPRTPVVQRHAWTLDFPTLLPEDTPACSAEPTLRGTSYFPSLNGHCGAGPPAFLGVAAASVYRIVLL